MAKSAMPFMVKAKAKDKDLPEDKISKSKKKISGKKKARGRMKMGKPYFGS